MNFAYQQTTTVGGSEEKRGPSCNCCLDPRVWSLFHLVKEPRRHRDATSDLRQDTLGMFLCLGKSNTHFLKNVGFLSSLPELGKMYVNQAMFYSFKSTLRFQLYK